MLLKKGAKNFRLSLHILNSASVTFTSNATISLFCFFFVIIILNIRLLSPAPCPGYTLLPAGKADNLSDSSHSEISSRSSICSVDSMPAPGPEERCISSNRTCTTAAAAVTATTAAMTAGAVAESTAATHAHLNVDYNQPSTRYLTPAQLALSSLCVNQDGVLFFFNLNSKHLILH